SDPGRTHGGGQQHPHAEDDPRPARGGAGVLPPRSVTARGLSRRTECLLHWGPLLHVLRVKPQKLVEQLESFARNAARFVHDVVAGSVLSLDDSLAALKGVTPDHVLGCILQQNAGLAVVDAPVADDEVRLALLPAGRNPSLPADVDT